MVVQHPVNITVRDSPTRIGSGFSAPFTIVNKGTDTTSTVWLADNPGIIADTGTPLYPGTTLVWEKKVGEVWGVCESRGQSTVVVTSDVFDVEPDPVAIATAILNSGMLIIDDPVTVFNGTIQNTGLETFDITRYQSVIIKLTPTNGTPTFANFQEADVAFSANGIVNFQRHFTFINANPIFISLPAIGDQVTIRALSVGATQDLQALVTLSHRPYSMVQNVGSTLPAAPPTFLTRMAGQIVGAGASFNHDEMIPWYGDAVIQVQANNGGVPNGTVVNILDPYFGSAPMQRGQLLPLGAPSAGTQATLEMVIPCSGQAFRVNIANNTGADRTYTLLVRPRWLSSGMF